MTFAPSAAQLAALEQLPAGPLALFYEFSRARAAQAGACRRALGALVDEHGGCLSWAGTEEQVLAGKLAHYHHAALLHFPSREVALGFVSSAGHAAALGACTALQIAALGEQPRIVKLVSGLLARILPRWPFDDTVETTEEPGIDVSTVMPTSKAIAEVRGHPDQASPVTMINWLKFRKVASYANGAEPVSGKAAYYRYGKVAMASTHSLGAKLLFAARYRFILVGNHGEPGEALWDEFALMQYPGRATFGHMAQLRRYRRGLADREAGLAEWGQGLTLSRPEPEFTWRR